MCVYIGVIDVPKISSQESVETFNIVPQERISERMCEKNGVVEVLKIASQESVEGVKCVLQV